MGSQNICEWMLGHFRQRGGMGRASKVMYAS